MVKRKLVQSLDRKCVRNIEKLVQLTELGKSAVHATRRGFWKSVKFREDREDSRKQFNRISAGRNTKSARRVQFLSSFFHEIEGMWCIVISIFY